MWQKIQKVSGPIALALVLLIGILIAVQKQEAPESVLISRFDSSEFNCLVYTEPGCSKQVVASGGELEIASGGTLDVIGTLNNSGGTFTIADAASVTGAFAASSTGSFADKLTSTGETVYAASVITPSTSTLTPTSTFYIVNSSGTVTLTIDTTGATAGQMVWFYGDDANTITIADTNLRSHDGAALSMGQYDLVGLMFSGIDWVQIIELANQ